MESIQGNLESQSSKILWRGIVDIVESYLRIAETIGFRTYKTQHHECNDKPPKISTLYAEAKNEDFMPLWRVNARYEESNGFGRYLVSVNGPEAQEIHNAMRKAVQALPRVIEREQRTEQLTLDEIEM